MNTGIIIQARTGSSRLPDKILKKLPYDSNITVLEQVIRRLSFSKLAKEIIIATTTKDEEQPIIDIANRNNVKYYRGSEEDVLSRYYYAAKKNNIDIIVRITSDCPCCDSELVDNIITVFLENDIDYISNVINRTYPRGYDVEVFSFKALEESYKNAVSKEFREHVTLYVLKNMDKFKTLVYSRNIEFDPNIRLTLDTEIDYTLLCQIYDELYNEKSDFNINDVYKLYKEKPWIFNINRSVIQKKAYDSEQEEIADAVKICEKQGLYRTKNILEQIIREKYIN